MFRTEYKREMDALEPSREAMARLEALTRGEAGGKPGKRFGRRAIVALAPVSYTHLDVYKRQVVYRA